MRSQIKRHVAFRRKREGKTDYKRRRLLLTSQETRLVVRTSLKHVTCQLVAYAPTGDNVLITVHSKMLTKLGWPYHTGNLPAAYLTGFLLGKKAKEKKLDHVILDTGLHPSIKGNRIYAAARGAKDAGLDLAFQDDVAGDEKRLKGEHIASYAKKLRTEKKLEKVFSKKADPEQIPLMVEKIKKVIMG